MRDKILEILGEMDDDLGITAQEGLEKITPIIKDWALEMVGEYDNVEELSEDAKNSLFIEAAVDLVNDTKQEIRERIEKSLV